MGVLTLINDDQCMPIPLILIAAAIAFVVVLCVVLWLADVTGGTDTDHIESMR